MVIEKDALAYKFKHGGLSSPTCSSVDDIDSPPNFHYTPDFNDELRQAIEKLGTALSEDFAKVPKSQRRYRQILNALSEGVILVDENEKIRFCNPACERIFESQLNDVVGKSILDFVGEDDREKICTETEKRKIGAASSYEISITTPSSREKYLLVNVSPFCDAEGNYDGAVGVVIDITQRKRAEEELRQFARELKHSNEMKDLFADILRHDLLGPVGIVKAYAETLLDNEHAPREEFLKTILENCDKVIGIIDNARELAVLEAAGQLERKPSNLSGMIRDAAAALEKASSERGIALVVTGEKDIYVSVNPVMREVFWNLISNAIKYSPRDKTVVVEVSRLNGEAQVAVKDSGEGIPDEAKEYIFERFARASRGEIKGTGLGLAIAKRIVELHGGRIWVEDNPESGSIFFVNLPISPSGSVS